MLTEQDKGRVYNAGIRLLTRREYGVIELTKKLSQKHPPQLVEQVVSQLLEQNLLSDSRFAESLCNSRIGRGYGPIYIFQELSIKGIANHIIGEFIDKNDPAWLERAIKAGRKKASPLLLEKYFMQSEAFEEEFLRQKGVDEHDLNGEDEHLFDDEESEGSSGVGQYDEYEGAEDEAVAAGFPKSRKLNNVSQSKHLSSSRLRTKPMQTLGKISKKTAKKVIYRKTREQLFKERKQSDWMKVASFLSRRGFPGDLISKAMRVIAPN